MASAAKPAYKILTDDVIDGFFARLTETAAGMVC
jgi:hypothetical protein